MSKRGNPNLVKGVSGNPKGKPKGIISKKQERWNELVSYLMDEGIDRYINAIRNLEDDEYVNRFTQILNYVKPKLQAIDQTNSGPMRIIITNEQDDGTDSEDSASDSAPSTEGSQE